MSSRFKKGDKVVTPNNSHYNDKPYIIVDIQGPRICLREVRNHWNNQLLVFMEHELEFWDVYNSPLWRALK